MPIFEHSKKFDDAVLFSRFDDAHPLSTVSMHPFVLEDTEWRTAEHYYQSSKMRNRGYAARIASQTSAMAAHNMGNSWWRCKRRDFRSVRIVLMTRALYSKARQHPEIADYLTQTGSQLLVETSQYDLFWGIGRDQRGQNHLGKIWMDVREKMRTP